eukprot:10032279-Alexandrium_andersonii.AAC.1
MANEVLVAAHEASHPSQFAASPGGCRPAGPTRLAPPARAASWRRLSGGVRGAVAPPERPLAPEAP